MKNLAQILFLVIISIPSFAQENLVGEWRISSQKKLILTQSHQFTLTKGPKVYKGK